jgi:hypothetical protein
MAPKIHLTLDCAQPTKLAEFWKFALGYADQPPPSPFTSREEWLATFDLPDDDADDGAWLHDPTGIGPNLSLQQVSEPKTVKNRLHMDIDIAGPVENREALLTTEATRLANAGATMVRPYDGHHIVLADPEGNEFCIR